MIMNGEAGFDLAVRLRTEGAPLGEVYAFISGLYFRGKLAYATAFGTPLVITAGRGLLSAQTIITLDDLRAIAAVPIDLADPLYREPLEQAARTLDPLSEVVLLGSIATSKYLEPLKAILGSRLLFPSAFIGRGDMSRGGLMLRCARDGTELEYIPASTELRRGRRPPKLESHP
jgi:hypothetical protein